MSAEGLSFLPALRVAAHAVFDVAVDDEVRLLLREAAALVHFVVDTRPARLAFGALDHGACLSDLPPSHWTHLMGKQRNHR